MGTEALTTQPTYSTVRRWPRYKLNVPVRIISDRADKTVITQGRGTELNGGGLAVFAGVELKLNQEIDVEFTPPYGEPIRVTCTVRNRRDYNYGLEFRLDTDEEIERVTQIRGVFMSMGSRLT